MKKLIIIILSALIPGIFASCSFAKKTFDTTKVRAGMTKEEVTEQFGKPYKTAFFTNRYNEVIEQYQYAKFFLGAPYNLHYLEFRDGRLISSYAPLVPDSPQPATAPQP